MKRWIIPLVVLAAIAGAAYAYAISRPVTAPLTGLPATSDVANRRPVAVMIDNYTAARPQSGLDQASMVFETLAEGGITRFMAVYLLHDADTIGPVRSTRLYFNSWAAGLHAIFGHDGGNVDALQQLPHLSTIYNIDANRTPEPYWRVSTRIAPHNEYTGSGKLRVYAAAQGGTVTGSGMRPPHKDDAPASARPAPFYLHIQFSYADYNVAWKYDPTTNDFLRYMGGAPHDDAITGRQLRAKNVIVMFTQESPAYDPFTPGSIHLRTEGTGAAQIWEDGRAIDGTWSKQAVDSPLQWLDAQGNPVKLDRGVTWVEIVPQGNQVSTSNSL